MDVQRFQAEASDAGRRLDQFLVKNLPDVSRARMQELIEAGTVRIDGKAQKASYRMRGDESVEVAGESKRPPIKAEPEAIEVEVVLDDAEFAVVNKPAGMSVHAGAGDISRSRGTLVNAMLHRFKTLSPSTDELRPGIVHRLDRETSGLVIIAKTGYAHHKLAEQFQQRTVKKTYVALVHGAMPASTGTVNYPIERDPVHRTRMRALRQADPERGRHAVSHYKVIEQIESQYGIFSLLEVRIETGRTHQIRVHLAALRHPIVGDSLYGAPSEIRPVKREGEGLSLSLERNFLHAAQLEFKHPRTGETVKLSLRLPEKLEAFLNRLRSLGV